MAADPSSTFPARIGSGGARTRAAVKLAFIFFAFTLVVFTVAAFFRGPESFRESIIIAVPMMAGDGFLAFLLFFPLSWTARLSTVPRWTLMAVCVLAVALLQAVWDTQLRIWVGAIAGDYGTTYLAFVRAATINVYNSGMFAALLAFQGAFLDLRAHQGLLDASRRSERDAHMLALRFQLNPHFLFNTLNAISSLVIVGRAEDAESMIDRLSSFLRASLTADPHSLVSVDEEFEMLDSYLEIEGVRFGDRLIADIRLPPNLAHACVPPFLLQPLVENAIKYAVAPSHRPVRVTIAAEERGGRLVLVVEDDGGGCGDVGPGTGIGLANVRERLRLNYGARARLEMRQDGSGCQVEIVMPLERTAAADGAAEPAKVLA
ncbi:sensor histidine kinase [Enterovirga sp. GCM10030262]|uniref:sensor histidine kinase n=1 Tax=Enterovirga sp. GCM10030262 TaxID=3273391 RepID=UPI00360E8686